MWYLTEHGSNSSHLEKQPLDCLPLEPRVIRKEFAIPFLLSKVHKDCTTFHNVNWLSVCNQHISHVVLSVSHPANLVLRGGLQQLLDDDDALLGT